MPDAPLTFNAWLRHDLILRALTEMAPIDSVLEIGAGQGSMGSRLAGRFDYTGLEPDETSWRIAQRRVQQAGGGRVLRGDTSQLPPDAAFDLVCAFEVLEHIGEDVTALREWCGWLRPGGWVLLSVPAWQHRFAAADVMAGHFRRYSPEQMCAVLRQAGFEDPRVQVYGFPLGYALEAARNVLAARQPQPENIEERTAASGRFHQPATQRMGTVTRLTTAPFRVAQRPFLGSGWGTGLVARARKPR